jgi:hypothetical protein
MTGSRTSTPLEQESLEKHRQVHFYLERLERSLEELDPDSSDPEQLSRLVAEIEIFKERLEEHNTEEGERIHQGLADLLPSEVETILRLSEQHHRIIEVLEMAVLHARDCRPSGIADLRDDLRAFLKEIRDHENVEEALLEEAMGR